MEWRLTGRCGRRREPCGSSRPGEHLYSEFSMFKEGLDVRTALNRAGVVRISRTALRH
jgi:hypothetical protein